MELLACFVLDGVRVVLQMIDVLVKALVLLLKLLHLLLECFGLFALVGEGGEAVMAEDDAVGHNQGERSGGDGGGAATPQIDAILGGAGDFRKPGGEFRLLW